MRIAVICSMLPLAAMRPFVQKRESHVVAFAAYREVVGPKVSL